uniref:Uncharacterized protein n=1 Tax=Setaria viridis TaxID=4556 RepID=A0A4U6WAZ8_SETVI|nr:hypothetical protein SEVIR_1G160866v2 [Setaria viridis]
MVLHGVLVLLLVLDGRGLLVPFNTDWCYCLILKGLRGSKISTRY